MFDISRPFNRPKPQAISDRNVVAFENPFYSHGNTAAPVASQQMVYDNDGHQDLYDEPAFLLQANKENPLFNDGENAQPTYDGGEYGDYGQPVYEDNADYVQPVYEDNGDYGYNYMPPSNGGFDEFGQAANAVVASSQPMYGNDMQESYYGDYQATGFNMASGFEGEAEFGGGDGYLDVAPDPTYGADQTYANDSEATYINE